MSRVPFELDWLGGPAERAFRSHRGDVDGLPWAAFDRTGLTDADLDLGRIAWTTSAHQEWCAAASFAALLQALLAARAPVDLIGMAGRFVADEMVHVELNARLAATFGGGVALQVDPEALVPTVDPERDPLERATTLAVRVSCVGETFSLPMLAATRDVTTAPLVRAVLSRIVRDEGAHSRVGWLVLDWALPRLSPAARERIAAAAGDAVAALRASWDAESDAPTAATKALGGHLGWLSGPAYAARAERVLARRVVAAFARRGLNLGAVRSARAPAPRTRS